MAVTQRRARPDRPEPAPAQLLRRSGAPDRIGAGAIRIAAILRLYEELVATLLARLVAAEDTTDAHVDVLNEWSAANNRRHAAAALELERLTAVMN